MAKQPAEPDSSGGAPPGRESARAKAAESESPGRESARAKAPEIESPGGESARAKGREPRLDEVPTRLVVVAYVLALVCAVAPLAVLGAGFAGAVLYQRGRRGAGAGVVAVAVLCAALGLWLLR